MSSEANQSEVSNPQAPLPASRGPGGKLLVLAAAMIPAAVIVLLPGSNSIFAAGTAAVLALIAVALSDWLVTQISRALLLRLVVGCLIGAAIGLRFQLTATVAFRRAFDCDSPAAVRDVSVGGHYLGGLPLGPPSDITILLQFQADDRPFEDLISQRSFEHDSQSERWWLDDAATVWRHLFGSFAPAYGGAKWRDIKLPKKIRILRWRAPPGSALEGTALLRDDDTGRTYVLYGLG